MNYNETNYYRANHFANQGYIPTIALKNRKHPQYASQIPQGVEHFPAQSRKIYMNLLTRSQISQQNVLSNPQKYPLQNRIAEQMKFQRNLNTIDIDGACASSKVSMGVRNKIIAQQQLMRRNAKIVTPILAYGQSKQQMKRKVAEQILSSRNNREQSLNNKKINEEQMNHQNSSRYYENKNIDSSFNSRTQNHNNQYSKTIQKQTNVPRNKVYDSLQILKKQQPRDINYMQYKERQNTKQRQLTNNHDQQSYQKSRVSFNDEQKIKKQHLPQQKHLFEKQRKQLEQDLIQQQFKNKHRLLNPTNLSYEGNFIRNSGVFRNLGKNISKE